MEEFKNNFGSDNEFENAEEAFAQESETVSCEIPETDEFDSEREILSESESSQDSTEPGTSYIPPTWCSVNYSEVNPINDYRPASKGLRVFVAIMAFVIVATAGCVGGYFMGRTSVTAGKGTGKKVELQLAARPDKEDVLSPIGVYDKVNKSVVGIRVYNTAGKSSDGSGVFYSKDGYIITNDHIYSEVSAPKFKVYTADGKEYDAQYIAGDTVSDLAVLKINGKFDVAEFGNSAELICGEQVVAIGRPGDATEMSSITSGIISLTKRRVKTTSNYTASLIQTDSAINPGSSGGALVNMYGQVVGITSAKLAGVVYDSVGYAIPTVTVKRVAEQLIKEGKVTDRAKLGITYTEMNSVTAEVNNQDTVGLVVVSVSSDSDAVGKMAEGDVITHINGKAISNDDIMLDVIDECRAGDKVTVTVKTKDGATKELTITLKANIGESSYKEKLSQKDDDSEESQEGSGGTFDFPFGE